MSASPDISGYVELDGELYPVDRIGPDGKPLPITEEQARAIAQVLAEEYDKNEAFQAVVNRRAEELGRRKGAA